METKFAPYIEAWGIALIIVIGYGFSAKWDSPSVLLLCIFLAVGAFHIVARKAANRLRPLAAQSRKQIRQMTPSELEQHLDTLGPEERRRFGAHLLEVSPDEDYLSKLSPEQRGDFDALLRKLKAEHDAAQDGESAGASPSPVS